jgi:hypothetical protein
VISKEKLKVGAYYFFVTYEDRDLTVPVIETLRFKSEVSEGGRGETLFLFDRVGEHEPPQCRLPEDLLETVFEFDGLVSELEANREAQRSAKPYEPRSRDRG